MGHYWSHVASAKLFLLLLLLLLIFLLLPLLLLLIVPRVSGHMPCGCSFVERHVPVRISSPPSFVFSLYISLPHLSAKCNGLIISGCSLIDCYVHVTLPPPPSLLLFSLSLFLLPSLPMGRVTTEWVESLLNGWSHYPMDGVTY